MVGGLLKQTSFSFANLTTGELPERIRHRGYLLATEFSIVGGRLGLRHVVFFLVQFAQRIIAAVTIPDCANLPAADVLNEWQANVITSTAEPA